MKILAINPGSTSTKVALFEDDKELWSDTQRYDVDVLKEFHGIMGQEDFRLQEIRKVLGHNGTVLSEIDAVVGRGGLLRPIPGGTYEVSEEMLNDLRSCKYGSHASNLGAPLAVNLANESGCGKAYIVDPVVVDELIPEARLSGMPEIERRSIWHALNQRAVARKASQELGRKYEEVDIIVAHMGGGISVGAHQKGKTIDVNNALDGEGPFSPERAGSLPAGGLTRLAFSGEYDLDELKKRMVGGGGLVAHLGTNDLREVQKMMEAGNEKAKLVFEALALQVAKEIGARAAVLNGHVDAVVLTGGLAYSDQLMERISERVAYIAPVKVYPGEDEMKALAEGALRVIKGEEEAHQYKG
ncbi:MAG TPA: butyrate kinase [Synergistales bacterium]|nr:butyrate kinase [Synergistales bacterium]